jgi:thioredoxin 2
MPLEKLAAHPVCGQCKTALDIPRAPINVTTASYDQQVQDWPEWLLADFWAKWCGYCRMMDPLLNELAAKRAGRIKIIRIDVDAEPMLARRFSTKATPTFILYRNGTQIGRMDGAPAQHADFERWMDQLMMQAPAAK